MDNFIYDFQHESFKLTTALAMMLFWIIFGYNMLLLNCNMQKILNNNVYMQHLIAICGFFYLIVLSDSTNSAPIYIILLKTLCGYILFMLFIKGNLTLSFIVLLLLLIDQGIAYHIKYIVQLKENNKDKIVFYETIRTYILYITIALIVISFGFYAKHAYVDHEKDFDFLKLFIGTNSCKKE